MESLETFQDSSFSPDTTANQMQVLLISLKSALSFHPGTTHSALTLFCVQPPTSSLPLVYPSSCAGLSPPPELDLLNTNLIMPLPWLKSSTTAHSVTSGIILTATEAPNTDNVASATCPEPLLSLSPPTASLCSYHTSLCAVSPSTATVLFCFSFQATPAPESLCRPNLHPHVG